MTWVVKLCKVTDGKRTERTVFTLGDICAPIALDDVGLSLDQGKAVMACRPTRPARRWSWSDL